MVIPLWVFIEAQHSSNRGKYFPLMCVTVDIDLTADKQGHRTLKYNELKMSDEG